MRLLRGAAFLLALATAGASGAVAQDDPPVGAPPAGVSDGAPPATAPAAPKPKTHPLVELLRDVQRGAHLRAHTTLLRVQRGQATVQASARLDANQNGTGEFACLQDLAGALPDPKDPKGERRLDAILDADFARVNDAGEVVVAGYVWRMFLPAADGHGVHETKGKRADGVAVERAEGHWTIYAWPRAYGRTGRFTFHTDASGDVTAVDAPEYSGEGHGPSADAACDAGSDAPGMLATSTPGAKARDGRTWRGASTIRPDEISPADIPSYDGPWRDAKRVDALFTEALDDVERELGSAVGGGRPKVRIVDFTELEAVVRLDIEPVLARLGLPQAQMESTIAFAAASLLAKYDRRTHSVLLSPRTAEATAEVMRTPWILGDDSLRTLLVHEAVHAHDFRAHDLAKAYDVMKTSDEFTAWGAVVEGHAQFVAERVATKRGLGATFEKLAQAIAWAPKTDDAAMDGMFRSFSATIGFPYTGGLRFFHEIEKAGGVEAVARALRDPPKSVRDIEHPLMWLRGENSSADTLAADATIDAVLERFAKLGGEGWVTDRPQVVAAAVRAQLQPLGLADTDGAVDRLLSMRVLTISNPKVTGSLVLAVMRCEDADAAHAMLRLERKISETKDAKSKSGRVRTVSAEYTDGVGAGNGLDGFVAVKMLEMGGRSQRAVMHVVRIGTYVLDVTVSGSAPEFERATIDAAFADVSALLPGDPASAVK
ncbi:MAG: hypothetical protein K8T90_11555 [Planctomycetes bacterium]|nr:hypothetical protein [Planctomycetota bacterium]